MQTIKGEKMINLATVIVRTSVYQKHLDITIVEKATYKVGEDTYYVFLTNE